MKVSLLDIPAEGKDVQHEVTAEEIGLKDETFVCLGPLVIDVRLDKTDTELLAQVQARGSFEFACARCLDPVRQQRHAEFELVFDITPTTEFVEYGDDIRQELLVGLMGIVRCREDCRGLCPSCGVNLNKISCSCPVRSAGGQGIEIQPNKKSKKK